MMPARFVRKGERIENRPGWEQHYVFGCSEPIIGKVGTIIEENEELLSGQAIRRRILRVDHGAETVIFDHVYHAGATS